MPDLYAYRLPLEGNGVDGFRKAMDLVRAEVGRNVGVEIPGEQGSAVSPSAATLRWRMMTAPGSEDRVWTEGVGHVADLLFDPGRVLPVVVISSPGRDLDGRRTTGPSINPGPVARSLATVAHVVVLDRPPPAGRSRCPLEPV